jgi:hypothetical protein
LVGGVAVGINKKAAVSLANVLDKEVHKQGGFSHATHALDIYMLGGIDFKFVAGNRI